MNFMTKVELKTKTVELFFTTSNGNPVIPDALVFSRNGKPINVRYTSQQDRVSAVIPEGGPVSVEFAKRGFKTEAFQIDLASKVVQFRFSVARMGRRAFDHKGNFQRVTFKFVVKNDPNMTVDTENTHIFLDGKNYSSVGYRSSGRNSLTLALRLTAGVNYELKLPENDVFIQSSFKVQFTPTEVATNTIERTITLEKKPTIVKFPLLNEGEFRMLGVVCKQLPTIPNPLYRLY